MTDSEKSFPEKEEKQNGLERVLECFPEMSWYHFGVRVRDFVLLLDFQIQNCPFLNHSLSEFIYYLSFGKIFDHYAFRK